MADAAPHVSFDDLYAEIERSDPRLTAEILELGIIRTTPRPGRPHRRAHKSLLRNLGAKDEDAGGRGWWIELEPELRLLDQYLVVPDLAGWRTERVPDLPPENPLTIVPDWACEILSPSTQRDDRHSKLPLYARAGVTHVWLVDPDAQLVEVFETVGGRPTRVGSAAGDEVACLPPFDDLPLALTTLFLPARA